MITPSKNYFKLGNTKAMAKMLLPSLEDKNVITFTRTYNPSHQFSFDKFKNCIKSTTNTGFKKVFNDKKLLLATRQPKKLRNLLVRAKFEIKQSRNHQN